MTTATDLAFLSSISTQIEELAARITEMAERYGVTPDSAVAGELFSAERALLGAGRSLERATLLLDQLD